MQPVPDRLSFEDLPLGGEWTTRGRTITEADVAGYIALAGDFNPLYADAHYAASGPHQGVVLPGPMIASIAVGLGTMDTPLPSTVALVGMTWRFVRPARPGDTLYTRWRLGRKRSVENPDWGLSVWQVEVRNQDRALVATGEVARLVERRTPLVEVPAEEVEALEPAAEEQAAEPEPRAAGGRRRRRRRGGDRQPEEPAAAAGPAEPAAEEPAPEPAPEAPARPRRRRS
ncbi:MAG: MaoC family dehydratase, partial [bacterium]|nr:MaoC family dehydratase [bacterium]